MIGTICYDCESGLGILAKSFIDHGVVDRILVIPHPHYRRRTDWYTPEQRYDLSESNPRAFLSGLDTILLFENWWNCTALLRMAQKQGIRIVLMPMYEYTPQILPFDVDLYLCPSLLDLRYYPRKSLFLPVPVDVPWRQRTQALHFVHNAGHGGKDFRNGTPELLAATELVKSPAKFTIRAQPTKAMIDLLSKFNKATPNDNVEYLIGNHPEDDLYSTGDVFIFPEKFNGLSLPLQEAYASGMLVMATDRFPMNTWLSKGPLILVDHYEKKHIATTFDSAVVTPQDIAATIDAWYGKDITRYSNAGRIWADSTSWEVLKPCYMEALLG